MPTTKYIWIGNLTYVPGEQLTPAQMAILASASANELQNYPSVVLQQFFDQGGQHLTIDSSPTTVNPTTDPAAMPAENSTSGGAYIAYRSPKSVNAQIAGLDPVYIAPPPDTENARLLARYPAPVDTSADPAATDARLLASQASTVAANQINTNRDVTLDDPEAARLLASSASTVSANQLALNNDSSPLASSVAAQTRNAQSQVPVATNLGSAASNGDWRVRLSLAQGADYLYKAPSDTVGILQPLIATNGVVFPYTPKIDMSYKSNYQNYDLTHSNFRGYFYQNSQVSDINISAHFTAQNTFEANYLLAVIHFFRSVSKMFYGKDAQRGTPPPLLFLSGLGQYQFNNHPCLLSEFTYNLPDEVDYLRAGVANQSNLNLINQNSVKQSVPTNNVFASIQRLTNAFTTKGALPNTPFGSPNVPNLASGSVTYVPTKMDINIRLHPINTRQQVSTQFSLQNYANGNGLKGGFW